MTGSATQCQCSAALAQETGLLRRSLLAMTILNRPRIIVLKLIAAPAL
jgi:hypothetical protein